MQRDLSTPQCSPSVGAVCREIYQCHSASHLHNWKGGGGTYTIGKGGDFGPLQGWDLIEAKANILNKKLKFLHCAVKII